MLLKGWFLVIFPFEKRLTALMERYRIVINIERHQCRLTLSKVF